MIQANELRVGNWIHNPVQNVNFKVDLVALSKIYYDEQSKLEPRYQPIPITEDILLKIGFTKESDYRFFKYFDYHTKKDWDKIYCDTNNIDLEQCIDGEIRKVFYNENGMFLHELQNLYFVLTKTELTINL